MPKTTGEYLVGIDFNPSNSGLVARLKTKAAELINEIYAIPLPDGSDPVSTEHRHAIARCRAIAISDLENAAMWAVKAATKQPNN